MIFKINLEGTKVLETLPSMPRSISGHITDLLNRKGNRTQVGGFLWARINPDHFCESARIVGDFSEHALDQVQDLVLRRLGKDLNPSDWSISKIKKAIKILKT